MNYYGRGTSVALLSVVQLLERAVNYGLRAVLILYAVDAAGLDVSRWEVLNYFNYTLLALVLIELPLGVITDRYLGQKKAVTIGGGLSAAGSLLIVTGTSAAILFGLLLLVIGTGFVSVNLRVLFGRLYRKEEQQRDAAFVLRMIAVYIGSFVGALLLGILNEQYGYRAALAVAAGLTIVYWLLFVFTKRKIEEVEENIPLTPEPLTYAAILDADGSFDRQANTTRFKLVALVFLLGWLFTGTYNLIYEGYADATDNADEITLFSFTHYTQAIIAWAMQLGLLVTGVFLLVLWYKKSKGNSAARLAAGFLILAVAWLTMYAAQSLLSEHQVLTATSALVVFYAAEIVIVSVLGSYLTRFSDIRYSSTIVGAMGVAWYGGAKLMEGLITILPPENHLPFSGVTAFSAAVLLFVYRKKITSVGNGVT